MSQSWDQAPPEPARFLRAQAREYRGGAERPLAGYLAVMAALIVLVGAGAVAAWGGGRRPPSLSTRDVLLLAAGTHKLSRLLSKDAVTSPLRAPFTRYQGTEAPAEVGEEVRKPSQLRHAIGELVTCPFCLGLWVAVGFLTAIVFAPRFTRVVVAMFAALAGADFLQLAYAKLQQGE